LSGASDTAVDSIVGIEVVKARVISAWDCDKSLQACFGSREQAIEINVVAALEGYIAALKLDAPGLLADIEQLESN
jgi:hypothetical protein